MTTTLAFDIYGTLINTQGITEKLQDYTSRAPEFAKIWREKQLEYSFRRGLMRRYEDFSVCTRNALDYTDCLLKTSFDDAIKQGLMESYRLLPAFDDVPQSLQNAGAAGFRLFAFSNGSAEAVETLLEHTGIRGYFEGVISVDSLQTFKPDPEVYRYFLQASGAEADKAWLISSNPFDVIGAVSAGMKAAWLRRSADAVFDPWDVEPTITIEHLTNLSDLIR